MPQMMPVMWVIFPIIVMLIGLVVMMINDSDKVEFGSEMLVGFGVVNLEW